MGPPFSPAMQTINAAKPYSIVPLHGLSPAVTHVMSWPMGHGRFGCSAFVDLGPTASCSVIDRARLHSAQ